MLKKLLSREGKEKVAERAKGSLATHEQPSTTPSTQTDAQRAAPNPQARRKSKSMRDSDIKDEFGRSAEELAAEAAREFDIMGLAERVRDMPEAPGIRPAPKSDTSAGTGEYGAVGQTPTVRSRTVKSRAVKSRAVRSRAITSQAIIPEQVAPEPIIEHIFEEAEPVPALRVESGHILNPGPTQGSADASLLARNSYWAQYGESDEAFLGYEDGVKPEHAPDWPSARQQFRIVRTENSLILASDGLSDPFQCFRGPADENGFGQEVFIEVPGLQAADAALIRGSWVFRAIEYLAQLVAHNGGIGDLLAEHGVMSLDLPNNAAPRDWIVSGVAEPAGALIDIPMPRGRNEMPNTPLSAVKVVPLTLIFPEELEDCVVGGQKERNALVNDMLTTGQGHQTDTKRASLR